MADRQQLGAIERARQRVAALVVDPVVDTDAVLDGVMERGFARPRRLLARLQRQPLLRGVLVHEQRRRLLVARDEPAADERISDAVQVRRPDGKPQSLGQPRDEPLLLGRPHFDGSVDVGGVQRVRERCLPRERRRRALAREHRIPGQPAAGETDGEHRCRRGSGEEPARHAWACSRSAVQRRSAAAAAARASPRRGRHEAASSAAGSRQPVPPAQGRARAPARTPGGARAKAARRRMRAARRRCLSAGFIRQISSTIFERRPVLAGHHSRPCAAFPAHGTAATSPFPPVSTARWRSPRTASPRSPRARALRVAPAADRPSSRSTSINSTCAC